MSECIRTDECIPCGGIGCVFCPNEKGENLRALRKIRDEKKKLRGQKTLAPRTIASTGVVLHASRSIAIPRRVLERSSARATDNWSQIYLAKTTLDDELHGVNLMASWTDIEKLVDIFCLEFFRKKLTIFIVLFAIIVLTEGPQRL